MPLSKVLFLIFILFFSIKGHSQDFSKQFDELTLKKDTARQSVLLKKWEKLRPADAELFTSYFNYYVEKSIKKVSPADIKKRKQWLVDSTNLISEHLIADSIKKEAQAQVKDTTIKIPAEGKLALADTGKKEVKLAGIMDTTLKLNKDIKLGSPDTTKKITEHHLADTTIKLPLETKVVFIDTGKAGQFVARKDTVIKVSIDPKIALTDTEKKEELLTGIKDSAVKLSTEPNVALTDTGKKSNQTIRVTDTTALLRPALIDSAIKKQVVFDTIKNDDQGIAIDTTTIQPEVPAEDSILYDPEYLRKAFEYINRGIAIYPNRIDMRFSKIYILGQYKDYDWLSKEIIKTLEYSVKINNAWLETDNKHVQGPQNFMLDVIQDFIGVLFEVGVSQTNNIKAISETELKLYPKHVESIVNLATICILNKNYEKGLVYFLRAEKLAPNDCIILSDMAAAYLENKDDAKAIACYSKIIKYGNKSQQETARELLIALQKK